MALLVQLHCRHLSRRGTQKLARNSIFRNKERKEIVPGPEQGQRGPGYCERSFVCTDWVEINKHLYSIYFLSLLLIILQGP